MLNIKWNLQMNLIMEKRLVSRGMWEKCTASIELCMIGAHGWQRLSTSISGQFAQPWADMLLIWMCQGTLFSYCLSATWHKTIECLCLKRFYTCLSKMMQNNAMSWQFYVDSVIVLVNEHPGTVKIVSAITLDRVIWCLFGDKQTSNITRLRYNYYQPSHTNILHCSICSFCQPFA